jgi:hypothetical protein
MMCAMDPDLGELLLQGRDMVARTAATHAQRWGLGSAQRWSLDQQAGRIAWHFEDRVASAPVQVLGSWSGQASTFVWSWDNETVLDALCRDAERVRAYGVEHDVLALSSSPLSLSLEQVDDLVALAVRVVGATGLYHPYDGRSATYLLFGDVLVERADGTSETVAVGLG